MTRVGFAPRKKDGEALRRFPHGLLKHSALEGLVDEINAWSNWDYTALVSKVE